MSNRAHWWRWRRWLRRFWFEIGWLRYAHYNQAHMPRPDAARLHRSVSTAPMPAGMPRKPDWPWRSNETIRFSSMGTGLCVVSDHRSPNACHRSPRSGPYPPSRQYCITLRDHTLQRCVQALGLHHHGGLATVEEGVIRTPIAGVVLRDNQGSDPGYPSPAP